MEEPAYVDMPAAEVSPACDRCGGGGFVVRALRPSPVAPDALPTITGERVPCPRCGPSARRTGPGRLRRVDRVRLPSDGWKPRTT